MKHIDLTEEEAIAIRWHMSGYDDAARKVILAALHNRRPLKNIRCACLGDRRYVCHVLCRLNRTKF